MIYVVGERLGTGRTRRRFADLLDVPEETMMERVCWTNLWDVPGQIGRNVVDMVERAALSNDAIVLLGRQVAEAFALDDRGPLTTIVRNGGIGPTVLLLPHPSGRNRWWNDPRQAADAKAALHAIWVQS